jgi:predicted RNase H-like HicB family nuclease
VQESAYEYTIEIFWSEEDGCFVACVPDLENCAAWGMSYEEALAQAHAAIRTDFESRRVFGEPISEPTPRFLPEQAIGYK